MSGIVQSNGLLFKSYIKAIFGIPWSCIPNGFPYFLELTILNRLLEKRYRAYGFLVLRVLRVKMLLKPPLKIGFKYLDRTLRLVNFSNAYVFFSGSLNLKFVCDFFQTVISKKMFYFSSFGLGFLLLLGLCYLFIGEPYYSTIFTSCSPTKSFKKY